MANPLQRIVGENGAIPAEFEPPLAPKPCTFHTNVYHKSMNVRTTVELPEELLRQAKAKAALDGRKLKDLVEEGLRRVLEPGYSVAEPGSLYRIMKKYAGVVDSGIPDLATNPKHLEGFGSDSMGHR